MSSAPSGCRIATAQQPLAAHRSPRKTFGSEIAEEVYAGLTARPKTLPPKLFYDARGSELFHQITQLPEYYLTRSEQAILEANADAILASLQPPLTVVELGAGYSVKTRTILRAVLRRQPAAVFVPIDVSPLPLQGAKQQIEREFENVRVRPLIADYTANMHALGQIRGRKLVLYLGSSIGNFEPEDATELLRKLRLEMSRGDALLLGTDLRKSKDILIPAYDDAAGVTAEFNKNVLTRINRELGADFDLGCFGHLAVWNDPESRIEMHLESLRQQSVTIGALRMQVHFAKGERIHTENSYKYTAHGVCEMLQGAGLDLAQAWRDPKGQFALHLATIS